MEFDAPTRWSLDDLMPPPVDRALDQAFSELDQAVNEFEAMRDSLIPDISADTFNGILDRIERINILMSRLEAYADLWLTEDTQIPDALSLRDRVDETLTESSNRMLFFDLWFKGLPDVPARKLIAHSGRRHYFLEAMRQFIPYTLSEPEEKLINLKDVNGVDALTNLYDMITNRFAFTLDVEGETLSLTRDQVGGYFRHPSPDVRAAAYRELYRVYEEYSPVLAQIFLHRARDWNVEGVELRGHASAISARNLGNDLPDAVVDTLLEVCRANAGIFQRYFEMKARWLGLGRLRRYDIYAPLVESDKIFDHGEAVRMVLDSYEAFSPKVASLGRRVFDENHLDSETRARKRGGAFCYGPLPGITPWVMLNYEGRARDVATLAHELGHAIHNMLAGDHSVLTYAASLPLAETASVFAEFQLIDRLLKQETDPAVRRDLLAYSIDDAYVTVIRQAYFTLFEREAYRVIDEGGSVEDLTELYMVNLKEQFGEAVELSDEFKWEWLTVPHLFSSPFYTYAYSFGQLLVLALVQQYRSEGESFVPKYLRILSYGGSESPSKILGEAGLDVASPEFWQGGFGVIQGMIAELEKSSKEIPS
jgi:oligoendopeptidase F